MWYQNIGSMFFRFVTKDECDRQQDGQTERRTDGQQNYDPQDRASIAASRGKTAHCCCGENIPSERMQLTVKCNASALLMKQGCVDNK